MQSWLYVQNCIFGLPKFNSIFHICDFLISLLCPFLIYSFCSKLPYILLSDLLKHYSSYVYCLPKTFKFHQGLELAINFTHFKIKCLYTATSWETVNSHKSCILREVKPGGHAGKLSRPVRAQHRIGTGNARHTTPTNDGASSFVPAPTPASNYRLVRHERHFLQQQQQQQVVSDDSSCL